MKAVIFDMDGVIIDSQSIADQLLKTTCETLGVFLTDQELSRLAGASSRRFWAYVKDTYALPKSVDYYRSLYDVGSEIKAYESLSVDNNLLLFLRFLKEQGMKTAVATSASQKRMQAVLHIFDLSRSFDATVCDQHVHRSKPAPDIFLAAAKALGIRPRDCAVVEDTDAGILAAKDAEMQCFLYTKYTPIGDLANRADFMFEDFRVLQLWISTDRERNVL